MLPSRIGAKTNILSSLQNEVKSYILASGKEVKMKYVKKKKITNEHPNSLGYTIYATSVIQKLVSLFFLFLIMLNYLGHYNKYIP